jgi:hypothetical protein
MKPMNTGMQPEVDVVRVVGDRRRSLEERQPGNHGLVSCEEALDAKYKATC